MQSGSCGWAKGIALAVSVAVAATGDMPLFQADSALTGDAQRTISADIGGERTLMMVLRIRPGKDAQFATVVEALRKAATSTALASEWTVYEADVPAKDGTRPFVIAITPVVTGVSYDPIAVLNRGLSSTEAAAARATLADALAGLDVLPLTGRWRFGRPNR